jgi:rRNA maturation endonuclease Nob1
VAWVYFTYDIRRVVDASMRAADPRTRSIGMAKCITCGKEVDDDAEVCPHCGVDLTEPIVTTKPHCGTPHS